jgi:hypothetical protein
VTVKVDTPYRIDGLVKDLSRDAQGRILYVTAEGEVGRMLPPKRIEVLADALSGPFPFELRAVAETPAGDVALLDINGNVRVLPGGQAPAALRYADLYMIAEATDLIADANGNYLIASGTPSSGQRAVNLIQGDGLKWGYYLVKHQPVQLAHDPLTGGVLLAETTSGGQLQMITGGDPYRRTTPFDVTTKPGLNLYQDDGDMALEADGDVYWIAGGEIYVHRRANGTTSLFASGFQQLRGVVIAKTTGWQLLTQVPTDWSLYVAEGQNPTRIREIPGVGEPAPVVAAAQGAVPGRGIQVNVTFGFQAFELAADNQGRLLLGGTQFGSTQYVKRVTLTGTPSIATVATSANGLSAPIEGLCVESDDSIYALARTGTIHRITEAPLVVSTVFSDPGNQVTAGKDLALDVDGSLYVACREAWDFGKILRVAGGGATLLTLTEETRGLAANPLGGLYFSQWRNSGFFGSVDLLHFADNSIESPPGFSGMNYTNDYVWGDGDICVDASGSVYTVSEDDWSLVRYDPAEDAFLRIGSGYLNHPSGLAIAPSTAASGSTTGWSLYVSEFDKLWEKPSVPPPASTFVNAALGLTVDRTLVGAPRPAFGKPSVLAPAPRGGGILIGTAGGWVLALDPEDGEVVPVAGPADGLTAPIARLASGGGRILALDGAGRAYDVFPGRAAARPVDPARLERALAQALASPRRMLRARGSPDWYVLDGWAVYRTSGP